MHIYWDSVSVTQKKQEVIIDVITGIQYTTVPLEDRVTISLTANKFMAGPINWEHHDDVIHNGYSEDKIKKDNGLDDYLLKWSSYAYLTGAS